MEVKKKLNILFISATVPYPAIDGGRIRVLNLVQNLCKFHNVTFLCFITLPTDDQGIRYLNDLGINVIGIDLKKANLPILLHSIFYNKPLTVAKYFSFPMLNEINKLLRSKKFDIVHFEMLHTGQYIKDIQNKGKTKIILDEQNIDSSVWFRLAKTESHLIRKVLFYWQYKCFKSYEKRICRDFNRCLCVSKEDSNLLRSISPETHTEIVPNGVDPHYFSPHDSEEDETKLVFTGSMDWQPNEDAVIYFCQEIFPLIRSELTDMKFFIVGSNPTDKVLSLRDISGVYVTGLVDDVRPYIANSAIYVVPLRIGGGTRLKILQALAMKKAVISTSVGCEGIDIEPGKDLIVSDDSRDFANKVIMLSKDRGLRRKLGENGRSLILQKYDWKAIVEKLESIYVDIIEEKSLSYE